MTLLVPRVGEELALKNFLNETAPQSQELKLYKNDVTPADTDTDSTYTEVATLTGYAAKPLTGTSWTINAVAPREAEYTQQIWTFTANFGETIYGYFVVQDTSGILMWAERFSSSFTPANSGDQVKVTPKITAD